MADVYSNPFSGMPQEVSGNGFWSGANESARERTMAPFLGMEQQRQQMELQKLQQIQQEFMSPEAQRARMTGFGSTAATNEFNTEEAKKKLSLLPQQKQFEIEQLSNKINNEKAKPVRELLTQLGGMAQRLEKATPDQRPLFYHQELKRWQQMNPGAQIPEQFREYNPSVLEELKNIEYALVFTPTHQQALGVKKLDGDIQMDREREDTRRAFGVAGIQQRGAMDRAKLGVENKPVNIPQRIVQLRKTLTDPETTQEDRDVAKEEMMNYLTDSFQKYEAQDPVLKSLSGMAAIPGPQGEQAMSRYKRERTAKWNEFLQQQGMAPQAKPGPSAERVTVISPDGKVGTLPADQVEAALKKGFKRQ